MKFERIERTDEILVAVHYRTAANRRGALTLVLMAATRKFTVNTSATARGMVGAGGFTAGGEFRCNVQEKFRAVVEAAAAQLPADFKAAATAV